MTRHAPPPAAALSDALARIWRRRRLFAAVFGGTLFAVAAAYMLIPTRFVAVGSVMVAEQDPSAHNTSAAWVQKLGEPADLETQLLLIRSPRLLRIALGADGVQAAIERECHKAARASPVAKLFPSAGRCDKLVPGERRDPRSGRPKSSGAFTSISTSARARSRPNAVS